MPKQALRGRRPSAGTSSAPRRRGLIGPLGLFGLLTGACYTGAPSNETTGDTDGDTDTDGTAGTGVGPTSGPSSTTSTPPGDTDPDPDGTTTAPPDTDGPLDTGTDGGPDPTEAEQMCMRWLADRADMSEGSWSGSVASCDPGDISADGRANALRLVNLYRWMVDLPEVGTDPGRDAGAQSCALLMHANGSLSHNPPMGWNCWSSEGSSAAGSSNISTGPGVMSVDLYMLDPGNPSTLGHRRWILSNSAGPIGLGSTSEFSCMWVIGGSGGGTNAWTAWPPPGPFPFEAVHALPFTSLDETGWSIQSDDYDLGGAQVSITVGGDPRPVSVTVLASGYGSDSAISMVPMGWTAQPDTTYHVSVTGVGTPIEYDVQIVDCG